MIRLISLCLFIDVPTDKLTKFFEIEAEFAELTKGIKKVLLADNIDVASLIEQLLVTSAVKMREVPLFDDDVYDKVSTIDDLWQKLNRFWSVLDYDVLMLVIRLTKCATAQDMLDKFLAKIDANKLKDIDLVPYCKVLQVKGARPWLRIKVVTEKCDVLLKDEVKSIICKSFTLEKYALVFRGIKEGCIEFIYEISEATMQYLQSFILNTQMVSSFAMLNITFLQINDIRLDIPSQLDITKMVNYTMGY